MFSTSRTFMEVFLVRTAISNGCPPRRSDKNYCERGTRAKNSTLSLAMFNWAAQVLSYKGKTNRVSTILLTYYLVERLRIGL